MVNYTFIYWNRLNYNQKCSLYSLVNDVVIHPSERFLNQWWLSLPLYKRASVFDYLFELKEIFNDK